MEIASKINYKNHYKNDSEQAKPQTRQNYSDRQSGQNDSRQTNYKPNYDNKYNSNQYNNKSGQYNKSSNNYRNFKQNSDSRRQHITTPMEFYRIIFIILLLLIPVKGSLNLYNVNEQTGFTEIHLDKADIVAKANIIVHLIDTVEITNVINDFKSNAEKLDGQHKLLLLTELEHLTNKVRTLIPRDNRQKRGLMNIVGNAQNWLFGTMDDQDRCDIDAHLHTLDVKNHNIIETINQQVGVATSNKNLLLFAIKIPKEFVTVQLKRLLPIPNKQNKEIDYPSETVFTLNENVYKYEKLKTLNELSLSKHCVYRQTCNLIKNENTEIIELDSETIIIKNAKQLNVSQNCDTRKLSISGNILIHFSNCTLKILDHYFTNTEEKFRDRFYYPTNMTFNNFTDRITLEDIKLDNIKNINKIKELQVHKTISYQFIILYYLYTNNLYKKKTSVIKTENR
ncbi:unnamed protein product [Hermetia illucens]|uniref:Uncharacterized protein n=1 Tax=Hermetia illucens TaxID=343691 RepID=A0A7R8YMJ6_HERIL|nr:unnamed protein product [Hermetia illucens]